MTKNRFLDVPEAGARISIRYTVPETADCIILLTHGAGAGINHWFITGLEQYLLNSGFGVFTFQFPFMEAGRRRTDPEETAVVTWNAAVAYVRDRWPELALVASGKSWGGRMLSHWAHRGEHTAVVQRLIFFGFPLHTPGRPSVSRAAHLPGISIPKLFLQGTRDRLASPDLMMKVTSDLPASSLIFFDGADHGFQSGKKNSIPQLAEAVTGWLRKD